MAKAELPPLSEVQLEIMNLVWDGAATTVGEVWKCLSARRPIARNTVSTLMMRLEEKGWLRHREESGVFFYAATVRRNTALRRLVDRVVDSAFQGSAENLVLTLLEAGRLSRAEVERIKAMLEEAEQQKGK